MNSFSVADANPKPSGCRHDENISKLLMHAMSLICLPSEDVESREVLCGDVDSATFPNDGATEYHPQWICRRDPSNEQRKSDFLGDGLVASERPGEPGEQRGRESQKRKQDCNHGHVHLKLLQRARYEGRRGGS